MFARPLSVVRAAVTPSFAAPRGRLAERAVWLAFAVLVAVAGRFLVRYGVNLPVMDEWDVLFGLADRGPTWDWVTGRHNEHRFVVGRLLWGLSLVATGYDFRAGGWLVLLTLTGSAAALVVLAKHVRGRTSLADALIPAVLLNLGHCFNLVMGYQVAFAAVLACAAGLLWCAVRAERGGEFRTGLAAGGWLLLMLGNGGFGVGFAPAVAAWVAYLAWHVGRDGRAGKAALLAAFPVAAAGYVGWTLATLPPPPADIAKPGVIDGPAAAAGYLASAAGAWLGSPLVNPLFAQLLSALAVPAHAAAVGRLAWVAWREPAERPRALGLLAVVGGHLLVAVGIGFSRGNGVADRYVTPSAVGPLACGFVALLYGRRRRRVGLNTSTALALVAAAALVGLNSVPVWQYSVRTLTAGTLREFEADLRAGVPVRFLGGKYGGSFAVLVGDRMTDELARFQAMGLGPFRHAVADSPMVARPAGVATPGPLPATLPDPGGRVLGLRLALDQPGGATLGSLTLRWRDATGERHATAYAIVPREGLTVAFRIDGTPTDLRLEPHCLPPTVVLRRAEWLAAP